MAAVNVEIESFVTKFKHLCSVCLCATLNIECNNDGETAVSLKVKIGKHVVPSKGPSFP